MKKVYSKIYFLLLISCFSYGQLTNFDLNVIKTDESCTGNGTLSFNANNTSTGAVVIYRIYKLPDTVNAIAILSANTFGGLTHGTYRVIATQTLGNLSNHQQQDVTVYDTRTNITFQLSSFITNCQEGAITVNVLTGNPVSYEIISGPVLVAAQNSNVFQNLPSGTYNIRVNDACGEGVVQTYTLTFSNPPNITINSIATNCSLNSCNLIGISYSLTAPLATTIRYPLSVQLTVFPPSGGTPIIQNQTIASGGLNNITISDVIPFYYSQLYTFDIKIIDACGNVYVKNGNQIIKQFSISAQQVNSNCLKKLQLSLCNFVAPYTINFLSAPAGFNPTNFNPQHPGPFTTDSTDYLSTLTDEIPNGTYSIQATDACNHTAICQIIIKKIEPLYIITQNPGCDGNSIVQIPQDPLTLPLVTSAVITSSTVNLNHPLPYDVSFNISSGVFLMNFDPGTYTIQGMDVCGHPYDYTFTIPPKNIVVLANPINSNGCNNIGGISVIIVGATLASITIVQAPINFALTLPYDVSSYISQPLNLTASIPSLPLGNYVLNIVDSCGNSYTRNVTIIAVFPQNPVVFFDKKGCGENFDSIAFVSQNGPLQTVIITAAPSTFPFSLPYDVSFNINTGVFYMNSFPEGNYEFYTKDICNNVQTLSKNIVGYHQGPDGIQVIPRCGSFDLDMNFTDNAVQTHSFWLQKFDPITNQWVHPFTNVVYVPNSDTNAINSYPLDNLSINYNIAAIGTFRILTKFDYYSNGTYFLSSCIQSVKTFDYTGELKIIDAYAIPCNSGGSQVYLVATGIPPLSYAITSKDGVPFLINNGNSNVFDGLQPGVYNFKVQDVCGNVVNRLFDISNLQQPVISASNLCVGTNGQLSVQPFSFLNYQWWKGTDTTTILSTTNVMAFNPYTNASAGVYHVRIFSTTTNSCVDRILDYTIPVSVSPNAGLDGTKIICGSSPNIDLFTILNGTYDSGGTWQEVTSSGALNGNNWLPTGLPFGTYIFKYTVNGFCSAIDNATVTITLQQDVPTPVITVNPSFCVGESVQFIVQSIPNATYQWIGPNNFSSTNQNPTISNVNLTNIGLYTVKAIVNQCEASATAPITVKQKPDYTYQAACEAGVYKVLIIPAQDSFDITTATYLWSGPNDFTSSSNPIVITNQLSGIYNVLVTNEDNCATPQMISVTYTFCDLPNTITPNNDGYNDTFDLSDFDVDLFQVYSRWGRLVYEESNYTNQWYGQNMHGGFLPDSTYYYIFTLKSGEEKHGWIFLVRGY